MRALIAIGIGIGVFAVGSVLQVFGPGVTALLALGSAGIYVMATQGHVSTPKKTYAEKFPQTAAALEGNHLNPPSEESRA